MLRILLILPALVLVVSGCAAPEETSTDGARPTQSTPQSGAGGDDAEGDDAPFTVLSAERRDGSCMSADYGEGSCHTLRVKVDNIDGTRDFSTNMFSWSAVSADGQVFSAPDREGADAIAGGHEGEITLKFDVDGDAKLATLRYERTFEDAIAAPIPDY